MRFITCLSLLLCTAVSSPAIAAEGTQTQSADYEVVVYWASWCAACTTVLTSLDALATRTGSNSVAFTAVNIGDAANARQMLDRKGGEHLTLVNGDATSAGIRAVPWIEVRDKSGRVVSTPASRTHPQHMTDWVQLDLAMRM